MKEDQVKAGQVRNFNGVRAVVLCTHQYSAWVSRIDTANDMRYDTMLISDLQVWPLEKNSDGSPAVEEPKWRKMEPWEIVTKECRGQSSLGGDMFDCGSEWCGRTVKLWMDRYPLRCFFAPASTPIPPDPGPGYKLLHPAVNTTADYQNAQWWYLGAWVDRKPCEDIIDGFTYRIPLAPRPPADWMHLAPYGVAR